jgi:NADPH2:quinone reductase
MRVIRVHQFGLPDVLQVEESEEPRAGSGQVVIAVEAAGVSFGDTSIRAGKFPFLLPFVPGWEVGGRVVGIGEGGDQSLLGQPVVALLKAGGGYSERVVANAADVFALAGDLSIEQALGVFLAGGTAIRFLQTVQIKAGETVLITAAAGNTGSQLLQLAKATGAGTVIGAAGGPEKCAAVSRLGADMVIDYSVDNWVKQVQDVTGGKGVDVVIDAVGGTIGRQCFELTANGGGRLVVYGSSSGSAATVGMYELAMRGITMIGALGLAMKRTEQETRTDIEAALQAARSGRLVALIGRRYPLEEAAEAHAAIEARTAIGKMVLVP